MCDPVNTFFVKQRAEIYNDKIQYSIRKQKEIQILVEIKLERNLNVSEYTCITYGNLSRNRARNIKYIIFIFNFKEVFKIISISPDVWYPVPVINVFQQKLSYYYTVAK
jgi:hypothetical protein